MFLNYYTETTRIRLRENRRKSRLVGWMGRMVLLHNQAKEDTRVDYGTVVVPV